MEPIDILLVEDNASDAELALRSLSKISFKNRLAHVKDGAEALDFVFAKGKFADRSASQLPRVIFLDIKMPKVDGIEVLRQIRTNGKTKTIPVVIMTSSKEEQDILTSYSLGVNSYVVKPLDFENFSKTIRDLGLYWLIINQPVP